MTRAALLATGLVLSALGLGLIALFGHGEVAEVDPGELPPPQVIAEASKEGARPKAGAAPSRRLATLALERGLELCEQGDVGAGLLWLARALRLCPPDAGELQFDVRANLAAWGREAFPVSAILPAARSVVFHPRDRWLLVSGGARPLQFLTRNGLPRKLQPPATLGAVAALAFSPDGRWFLTGGEDGKARLFSTASPFRPTRFSHPGPVCSVAFNRADDGATFLTGCADGKARLWRCDRTSEPVVFAHGGELRAAAISRSGRHRATAGGREARLWDRGGALLHKLVHEGEVEALAFSPDARWLATASADGAARLWDTNIGRLVARLEHRAGVTSLAFRPDGKALLTGARDERARVWDTTTSQVAGQVLRCSGCPEVVAFAPDGRSLLAGGRQGPVRVWEALPADGAPIAGPEKGIRLGGSAGGATGSAGDGMVGVTVTALSLDGQFAATGGEDGKVRLVSARTGRKVGPTRTHPGPVEALAFRADGRVLQVEGAGEQRKWPIAAPRADCASALVQWAEVRTGLRLEEGGGQPVVRPLTERDWLRARAERGTER